ncbi:ABC transporter substrate-binding protein [Alkalihalobacillus sp. AL-G]|uniref:ABC transporter substrate-binding protein n=1 Tax=Alkalihalobacillus sp. AL-G TaxID=2926399 RepID=UPI00272C98CD|nr:ABC transporter substrate-binding protein [Alkalihalobacillus sp. AL-G]WLD92022.1 ABC transporter substrate-binding protein [Alkalihalobacillus sp. AL-G]
MKRTIICLLALLLTIYMVPIHTDAAEDQVKSIKIAISKDESTLTPYTYITGYPGLELVHLLYDTLFQLDESNTPQPWLVSDYKVSDDGLTYEFTLHENVKWHDGKQLTADDVKFTVDYFLEHPKSRFTNPLKNIETLEVKSDTVLVMKLKQADPNFMIQPLADVPILPEHVWSKISNPNEASNALGSGPYQLEEYEAGRYYKMKANQGYFKGKPAAEQLIFPIIEDTTAMYTALKAGEVDAITSSLTPEVVGEFESNPNTKVEIGPGYSTTLFQINAEKYPMSETSFRQAIGYAIDTQYLVDTVTLGYAEVGSPGFIHPSSTFYNDELSFTPDKEKAKQILEEAGFKDLNGDGFVEGQNGEEISLQSLVYSSNPLRIRTAEIITEWLNEIGIKTEVRAMDATTVDSLVWPEFDVSKGRNFDLAMWGWSSTLQLFPDRLVELFHSDPAIGSVNIGGYSSEQFDQMAQELSATVDPGQRKEIILQMQKFVAEDFPIVPLYYSEIINAFNPNVYDGYAFQLGKGIMNKLSFVPSAQGAGPAVNTESGADKPSAETDKNETQTGAETENGNSTSLILLLLMVAVIVGGIIFLKKRTKGKGNRAA